MRPGHHRALAVNAAAHLNVISLKVSQRPIDRSIDGVPHVELSGTGGGMPRLCCATELRRAPVCFRARQARCDRPLFPITNATNCLFIVSLLEHSTAIVLQGLFGDDADGDGNGGPGAPTAALVGSGAVMTHSQIWAWAWTGALPTHVTDDVLPTAAASPFGGAPHPHHHPPSHRNEGGGRASVAHHPHTTHGGGHVASLLEVGSREDRGMARHVGDRRSTTNRPTAALTRQPRGRSDGARRIDCLPSLV